jgi:gamma-glutamylputrescine oxidase
MRGPRHGVSPWIEAFPSKRRPDFPRFRGTASYPAVIVGGGLAGCFTAYAFAAAGVKVALFEADRIGFAGGARGPGVLQGEAASSYLAVESRHGRKAARALFDASRRAVLDLATTARRLGIKRVETHDAVRLLASFSANEKSLMKEATARRAAGLDAVWLKSAAAARESGVEIVGGGMRLHDWAQADPYQLLTGFARAAVTRGAAIFERSPVRRVKALRKNAEIHTEGGIVTADTVIVCTGEPTDLYRSLKRHVTFNERFIVLIDKLPFSLRKQIASRARIVTDTETPPHVVRWLDDGRLVVAGADHARTAPRNMPKTLVQRTGQLMYELSRMYPAISGVMPTHGWDLPIATTADGVMYAGPHRNYPHHLFAWATQHDPAHAFLASRIVLRHYLGQSDRDDAYFAFTRG